MARTIRKAVADQLRVGQADMEGSITAGWLAANSVGRSNLLPISFGTISVTPPEVPAYGVLAGPIAVTGAITAYNYTVKQVDGSVSATQIPVGALCDTADVVWVFFANLSNDTNTPSAIEVQWTQYIE